MSAIANLLIKINADGKGVSKGVNDAIKSLEKLQNFFVGGAVGFYLTSQIKEAMHAAEEAAGKLADLHYQTGLSTTLLQQWEYALGQSGATVGDAADAFKHLQKSIYEALYGENPDSKLGAFSKFGVTLKDLKTQRPEEIFLKIAAAIEKMGSSAVVTANALELMGRGGDKMFAAFRQGFADEAKKAPIMDPELVQALDEHGDKKTKRQLVKRTWGGLLNWSYIQTKDLLGDFMEASIRGAAELVKGAPGDRDNIGFRWENAKQAYSDVYSRREEEFARKFKQAYGSGGLISNINENSGYVEPADGMTELMNMLWYDEEFAAKFDKYFGVGKKPKEYDSRSGGSFIPPQVSSDSLARIGLFRGGGQDSAIAVLQQQVAELRKIDSGIREMNYLINAD